MTGGGADLEWRHDSYWTQPREEPDRSAAAAGRLAIGSVRLAFLYRTFERPSWFLTGLKLLAITPLTIAADIVTFGFAAMVADWLDEDLSLETDADGNLYWAFGRK